MQRKIVFSIGEYYHVYSRGVEKRIIFIDESDRKRFLALLFVSNSVETIHLSDHGSEATTIFSLQRSSTLVDIGAYCLMPNHFHILLYEKMQDGISLFMKKLLTSFSMYFNKKYERSGPLFVKPFKAAHVTEDKYLKYLFSYIHLNPAKIVEPAWRDLGVRDLAKVKKFITDYAYSSLQDYTVDKKRIQHQVINKGAFPEYFASGSDPDLYEWLSYGSEEHVKESP